MIFLKFFALLVIFSQNSQAIENLFFEKLYKLLNFCVFSDENFDVGGNLLGIFIAKGQLKNLRGKNLQIESIFKKLEFFENNLRNENEGKKF